MSLAPSPLCLPARDQTPGLQLPGQQLLTHAYVRVVEIFLLSGEAVHQAVATRIPQLFLAATTTIVS